MQVEKEANWSKKVKYSLSIKVVLAPETLKRTRTILAKYISKIFLFYQTNIWYRLKFFLLIYTITYNPLIKYSPFALIKYLASPIKSFPSRSVMWRCNKYCLLAPPLLSFQMMIKCLVPRSTVSEPGIFAVFSGRALVPKGGKSSKWWK